MKKFISALVALALVASAAVFFVKMNEDKSEDAVIVVADSLCNDEDWQTWVYAKTFVTPEIALSERDGQIYAPAIELIELDGQVYQINASAQGPFVCGKVDENLVCHAVGE
ncbi:hypothetical protein KBC55_01370 [Patescibacteria group bacterium]|nr:hypothetical protein [Patescibacteria group bacterium]